MTGCCEILVLPYRDMYFRGRYGPVVRDLQIIEALLSMDEVLSVTVVNRPVSLLERLSSKRNYDRRVETPKLRVFDRTSYDILGPLKGRKWTVRCYDGCIPAFSSDCKSTKIVLDFLPIAKIDYSLIEADFVWYDLIDNFEKHNRFDAVERHLVGEKYDYVRRHADLITGVSSTALATFENSLVMPNGAGIDNKEAPNLEVDAGAADFGFLGFITDKFDVDFVVSLANRGYTIQIYGDFYDKNVRRQLSSVAGININGGFTEKEVPGIMRTFKVGLIPYLREKLHDESPLKLYQYLRYGHPVLSSVQYEMYGPYIKCYSDMSILDVFAESDSLLRDFDSRKFRETIASSIGPEHFWVSKLRKLLSENVSAGPVGPGAR